MHVVDIDIICVQTLQAGFNGGQDIAAAQSGVIGVGTHLVEHLGGENNLVTSALQPFSDNLFAFALVVHVGGVKKVYSLLVSVIHDLEAVGFIGLPAEHHGAEAE